MFLYNHSFTNLHNHHFNSKLESNSVFCSIDPAPPKEEKSIEELKKTLCNKELSIFKRYRALFALRNINTKESALVCILNFVWIWTSLIHLIYRQYVKHLMMKVPYLNMNWPMF